MEAKLCPCCSGLPYADCCKPYLSGEKIAPTAEALMRSRYSAYAEGDIDYLFKTSGEAVQKDFDEESSRTWSKSATWLGMEIVATEAGTAADEDGIVEFVALYSVQDKEFEHHEQATFKKVNGEWRFIDGFIVNPEPIRREEPKVGRNDPCPCGSCKKYKKCCGK